MKVFYLIFVVVLWIPVIAISGCQNSANNSIDESAPVSSFPADSITGNRYQYTQLHLGVQVRIVVFAEKEENAQKAVKSAFLRIATLEDIFSNYRQHSELNLLTTRAYNRSIHVSDELFYVLKKGTLFSKDTNGAFDVTLGPFIELWKTSRLTKTAPSAITIEQAFKQTGWTQIKLDDFKQTVMLLAPQMKLDLGGIAKGYILDEAMAVLEDQGVSRALIEAGGDIVVGAPPPGKAGWTIEIPEAVPEPTFTQKASMLKNAAIATSGDTEQFVDINGVRYAHIIDPRTGLGTISRKTATVIAPDGITADMFATALTVMEYDEADSLLTAHPEVKAYVRVAEQ